MSSLQCDSRGSDSRHLGSFPTQDIVLDVPRTLGKFANEAFSEIPGRWEDGDMFLIVRLQKSAEPRVSPRKVIDLSSLYEP